MINTVKDLKEVIQNLPDDMLIRAYNGGNGDIHPFSSHWILSKDNLTEEEIKGYNHEVISTLVLSID